MNRKYNRANICKKKIQACQDKCGENLDDMAELRMDHHIHQNPAIRSAIAETDFFLN
jgi:hypothetical protein